jgi:serine/threonine-protein kinase
MGADDDTADRPRARTPGTSDSPAAHLWRLGRAGALSGSVVADLAAELADATLPEVPSVLGDGRYSVLGRLGAGGAGQVVRAHDHQLGRDVAIKLLKTETPAALDRLLVEARAQARIDHPHVCKVYEAASHYIAMQLVDGPPLLEAAADLALADRVRLFVGVVRGVQAAHHEGLVHRDLKPSNVLVARGDGRLHPYVTDFGIAVDVGTLLTTGLLAGTPAYMSPEQARGQRIVDERADIYALGATLYALLTGAPPFTGALATVLSAILHDDPPPPRAVPCDLGIVVMKCLEKEPARRYASARDLGDDLERLLAGDPIRARAPSLSYRVARALRKHRALAAGGLAAALGLAAAGGQALRAGYLGAQRAAVAERFGERVAEMDRIMARAHTLPLHDLSRERALVRERIDDLAAEMARLGADAAGPGEVAVGRGWLVLGDAARARAHLEAAWGRGERGPGVAMALGLALGRLYEQGLADAARLDDADARAERKRQLAATLRDPALAYLGGARGAASEAPAYVEAQIALFEDHTDDAIAKAEAAVAAAPWLYEARGLAGQAHVLKARTAADAERVDEALTELERAGADDRQALDSGRSDPTLLDGECARRAAVVEVTAKAGRPLGDLGADAAAACDRALVADPDSVRALHTSGSVALDVARDQYVHLVDSRAETARAIERLGRALVLAPDDGESWRQRGRAYALAGQYATENRADPTAELDHAAADLAVARLLVPSEVRVQVDQASVYRVLAMYDLRVGRDPTSALDRAIASCEPATHDPRPAIAVNAIDVQAMMAQYHADYAHARGGAWRPWLERAIAAFGRVCAIEDTTNNRVGLAYALSERAAFESDDGRDPQPWMDAAEAAFARSAALGQNAPYTAIWHADHAQRMALVLQDAGRDPAAAIAAAHTYLAQARAAAASEIDILLESGGLDLFEARRALEAGIDPEPAVAHAEAAFAQVERAYPKDRGGPLGTSTVMLLRARRLLARRADPSAAFARAADALERAARVDGDPGSLADARAELMRWRAEWRLAGGQPATDDIAAGLAAAEDALARDVWDRGAAVARAELWRLRVRAEPGRPEHAVRAAQAVEQARAVAPHDPALARLGRP